MIVNLGRDLNLTILPEPLLAPPAGTQWQTLLSTEEPQYDGHGAAPIITEENGWRIPGEAAVVLRGVEIPRPEREAPALRIRQFPRIIT